MASFNKFMHPRNIYKQRTDFKELALQYPAFKKHATQDLSGKVTIDFKDPDALRALTTTLLERDFGLKVTIPEKKLVPTLPLRINYLLWIEDLLQGVYVPHGDAVHILDIGTGPVCIYALLGSRNQDWHYVATESDETSFACAKQNVENNGLSDKITVKSVGGDTIFCEVLEDCSHQFQFSMCNPPFFNIEIDDEEENKYNKKPETHSTGEPHEKETQGGEKVFIEKMIRESHKYKDKVRIFTTMIGHKKNFEELRKFLEEQGVHAANRTHTEFCQGYVMRWGLAWTWEKKLQLKNIPVYKKPPKEKPPFQYVVPDLYWEDVTSMYKKIKKILNELEIEITELNVNKYQVALRITAYRDTWTHSRLKRRAEKRKSSLSPEGSQDTSEAKEEAAKLEEADKEGKCLDEPVKTDESDEKATQNCERNESKQTENCEKTEDEASANCEKMEEDISDASKELTDKSSKNNVESPEASESKPKENVTSKKRKIDSPSKNTTPKKLKQSKSPGKSPGKKGVLSPQESKSPGTQKTKVNPSESPGSRKKSIPKKRLSSPKKSPPKVDGKSPKKKKKGAGSKCKKTHQDKPDKDGDNGQVCSNEEKIPESCSSEVVDTDKNVSEDGSNVAATQIQELSCEKDIPEGSRDSDASDELVIDPSCGEVTAAAEEKKVDDSVQEVDITLSSDSELSSDDDLSSESGDSDVVMVDVVDKQANRKEVVLSDHSSDEEESEEESDVEVIDVDSGDGDEENVEDFRKRVYAADYEGRETLVGEDTDDDSEEEESVGDFRKRIYGNEKEVVVDDSESGNESDIVLSSGSESVHEESLNVGSDVECIDTSAETSDIKLDVSNTETTSDKSGDLVCLDTSDTEDSSSATVWSSATVAAADTVRSQDDGSNKDSSAKGDATDSLVEASKNESNLDSSTKGDTTKSVVDSSASENNLETDKVETVSCKNGENSTNGSLQNLDERSASNEDQSTKDKELNCHTAMETNSASSPPLSTSLSPHQHELNSDSVTKNTNSDRTSAENAPIIKANIYIKKCGSNVVLELVFLQGTGGRDSLHQILNYMKNELKKTWDFTSK